MFESIHAEAHDAGITAARAAQPQIVGIKDHPEFGAFPICGFAWVEFKGNTAWARWAKRAGLARKHYPSGVCIWISQFNQSYDLKMAYAEAYAATLRRYDITAHADGRLD